MAEGKEKVSVENSGTHHYAKLSINPASKEITAGVIGNFSDHAAVALQFDKGVLYGTLINTGNTHSLRMDIDEKGSCCGTYRDSDHGGFTIYIKDGKAALIKGYFPEGCASFSGKHHKVDFKTGSDGKITGTIESSHTTLGVFKMDVDDGNVSGAIVHSGNGHETKLEVMPDGGLKVSVSVGKGNARFSFGAQRTKDETRAFAGIKLRF